MEYDLPFDKVLVKYLEGANEMLLYFLSYPY